MTQPGDALIYQQNPCETVQLLEPEAPNTQYSVFAQDARVVNDSSCFLNIPVNLDGTVSSWYSHQEMQFQSAVHMPGGYNLAAAFNPASGLLYVWRTYYANAEYITLAGFAREFKMVPVTASRALIAFEEYWSQPGIPHKVFTFTSDFFSDATHSAGLTAAEPVGPESQTMPALAPLSGGNTMLSWIGEYLGNRGLFCKVLGPTGATVAIPRQMLNNVENYVTAKSTLGIPVFGAVQRNTVVFPPADTLSVGLMDPASGGLLSLPLVTGLGIKTKFIRQEADGNVSLGYSIPEAGTTLLKVRRISGSSGATLWETTVADLGMASDEVIRTYPNVSVAGNADSVLYILARHDVPYSVVSNFQLVRLRENGQMGVDPLVPPVNLGVTPLSSASARVTWSDTNSAETHYIIARTETDFSGYHIIGAVPANETSFDDPSVNPDVQYHYIVAAYNALTGEFSLSEEFPYMFSIT
jgi:hypothetical protein